MNFKYNVHDLWLADYLVVKEVPTTLSRENVMGPENHISQVDIMALRCGNTEPDGALRKASSHENKLDCYKKSCPAYCIT